MHQDIYDDDADRYSDDLGNKLGNVLESSEHERDDEHDYKAHLNEFADQGLLSVSSFFEYMRRPGTEPMTP